MTTFSAAVAKLVDETFILDIWLRLNSSASTPSADPPHLLASLEQPVPILSPESAYARTQGAVHVADDGC